MPLKRHYEDPEALAGGREGESTLRRLPEACMSHHMIPVGRLAVCGCWLGLPRRRRLQLHSSVWTCAYLLCVHAPPSAAAALCWHNAELLHAGSGGLSPTKRRRTGFAMGAPPNYSYSSQQPFKQQSRPGRHRWICWLSCRHHTSFKIQSQPGVLGNVCPLDRQRRAPQAADLASLFVTSRSTRMIPAPQNSSIASSCRAEAVESTCSPD